MKSVGTQFSLLRTGLTLALTLAIPAVMGVACECDPPPLNCVEPEVEVDGECVAPAEGEGEGEPPQPEAALTIAPTVQNFGSVPVGDSSAGQDFTVTNAGDAGSQTGTISVATTGDFAVVGGDCGDSLGAGETCTVSVTFNPSGEGVRSGNVTATAGDLSASAALSGEGQGDSELVINPSTANFGNTVVNDTSASQTFTVSNNGDGDSGDLTVNLGGADGAHFSLDDNGCSASLASGDSCDITVSFAPSSSGAKTATLTVDGAAADPVTAALSGTAQDDAQLTISPTARNFGSVTLGADSTELDFTITNIGDVDTGVLGEAITGAGFAITAGGCDGAVLAPNASCTVSVTFSPVGAEGARTGTLTVDGAPGGSVDAALTGTAVGVGNLTINPTANDFGDQTINTTSASTTFTVTNDGGSATGLLSSVLGGGDAGDFQFVAGGNGCQGVSLPVDGTCTVAVTFRPGTAGDKSASVTVTDAASGDVAVAALSGNGLGDAAFVVNPTGIDFGSIAQNAQSANANIVVTNNGQVTTGTPTVTLGGANFSQFTLVANGCTAALAPTGQCTITVRYNPTAQAAHNATITVTGTPGGTAVTQLTGTGISPSALAFDAGTGGVADMGTVVIGGTGTPRNIIIRNNGQETSGVIATTLVGAGAASFTLTENCNTLTANATCTATVTFVPLAPGGPAPDGLAKVVQLQVVANPGATPAPGIQTGNLTGEALDKLSADPTSFNFNNVRIGSNAETDILFTQNVGTGAAASGVLTVTSNNAEFTIIAATGDDCAGANLNPIGVAPNNTCEVRVRFTPVGAPGARTATLTVTNAATASTATVAITGTAQGALAIGADQALRDGVLDFVDDVGVATDAVEVDDATLEFGSQPINSTSGLQRFLVINTSAAVTQRLTTDLVGGANFIIQSDTCAGAVLQPRTPAGAFPAGANDDCDFDGAGPTDGPAGTDCLDTCQIQGWFLPRTVGAKTGTITISGNAGQVIVGTFTGTGITAAQVTANPATVDFGTIRANANSAVIAVTVTNSGEQATGIQAAPTITGGAGSNPGEFDIVAAGSTCIDPDGAGPLITPPVLCNGGVAAGCPAGSLASCIVNVQFTPAANSNAVDPTKDATLTVSSVAPGGSDTVALVGIAASQLTINPTANNYGNDVIDTTPTAATSFTVTNNGAVATSALNRSFSGTNLDNFQFVTVPVGQTECNGTALAAGASCTISVVFNALAPAEAKTATLNVGSGGGDVSISAAVSGTSQDPAALEIDGDDDKDFGSILIGSSSATHTFTVRNTGDVTTSAITVANNNTADFDIVTNGCTAPLAPNATCNVTVAFSPADAVGLATITYTITNDFPAGAGDEDSILTGDGEVAGSVTITPSLRDFGSVVEGVDTATPLAFTITNTDTATSGALVITTTDELGVIGGEFDLVDIVGFDSNCGATLAAGASCTQFVRFTPEVAGAAGPISGSLVVTEAGGNDARSGLSGTALERATIVGVDPDGVGPGVAVQDNGTITFAATGVGLSASRLVAFQNQGDVATGAITGPALVTGNANQFTISGNTCTGTLDPDEICTFTVNFVPTAVGARTTQLTLDVADPGTGIVGGDIDITVNGTGDNPASLSIDPVGNFNFGNVAVTANGTAGSQNATRIYTVSNDNPAADAGNIAFSISNTTDFTIIAGAGGGTPDCVNDDPLTPGVNEGTVLGNGDDCEIVIRFNPAGPPGAETNTLTVTANPGTPAAGLVVTQSGTAVSQLDLTINGVGFIQTPVDTLADVSDRTTEDASFTVTNNGSVQSGVISVFLTKATEFSILANDCSGAGQTLAPGGDTCTLTVRYSPADATLNDSATLTVTAVPGDTDSVTFNAVSQN